MAKDVILLPHDKKRVELLKKKLEEYRARIQPFAAPEAQMVNTMKIAVLELLLTEGQVDTWEFSRHLAEEYKTNFSVRAYANACSVIEDYCKTGGARCFGGTGLKGVR